MKTNITALLVSASLLSACATTHPGELGSAIDKDSIPLNISAQTVEGGTGESFQLIEITVENTSDEWLKVANAEVVIGNPSESHMSVVLGSDLKDWAEAMKTRQLKEQHNTGLAQTALIALGAIATLSSDRTTKLVGATAAIGGTAWVAGSAVNQAYEQATQTNKAPETHLYHPFSVPGKMFVRRWILLNKPSAMRVVNLVIQMESVEGQKGRYEIKL